MARAIVKGARLAYVVVALEGAVKRPKAVWSKGKGISVKDKEEPAGFLVYFPRGHVIRLKTKEQLRHYGLDQEPQIINLEGLQDPRSPIGKLLMSQDDTQRMGAMQTLEAQVIALATAKSGRNIMADLPKIGQKEAA